MPSELPDQPDSFGLLENDFSPDEAASFDESTVHGAIPPADIIAYNEVRSCADLHRLYTSGKMEIQPDFQRDVVWKHEEKTRFIDSLVKQLPIPSMCFSLDPKTQRWKVIDGLQRMTSINEFLGEKPWQLSKLDDIHPLLRGASNLTLKNGEDELSIVYSSVQNVTIPVTVIRCDYTKKEHMQYLFTIFRRLNSGGVRLNNQEIRNCIYSGELNSALKSFDNENQDWIAVKKRIWGNVSRFRSVEILLRVLAFSEELPLYEGNLTEFLNNYMQANASNAINIIDQKIDRLSKSSTITRRAIERSSDGKLSLAVVEAIMVAAASNYMALINEEETLLQSRYITTLQKPAFMKGAKYAVSSIENVKQRLNSAISAFGGQCND